ncbi:MAG: hypothetical protein JOZ04_08420 [Acidimicrobiia bacterium]|nr:hypothetical protein [Acidimicrobiia bacterium]
MIWALGPPPDATSGASTGPAPRSAGRISRLTTDVMDASWLSLGTSRTPARPRSMSGTYCPYGAALLAAKCWP